LTNPAVPRTNTVEQILKDRLPPHAKKVTVESTKARGPRMYCVPNKPGSVFTLSRVPNTAWTIEAVAQEAPCATKLHLRHEDGRIEEVPLPAAAYYYGVGRQFAEGILVVLNTIALGEFLPGQSGRLYTNEMDPSIIAITRRDAVWSKVSTVVDLDEAVWLAEVKSDLRLSYYVDSLFEHKLFVQEGRPNTDGLYEMQLNLQPSGELLADEPVRIGDYVLNFNQMK
jgi:hypothetical protein